MAIITIIWIIYLLIEIDWIKRLDAANRKAIGHVNIDSPCKSDAKCFWTKFDRKNWIRFRLWSFWHQCVENPALKCVFSATGIQFEKMGVSSHGIDSRKPVLRQPCQTIEKSELVFWSGYFFFGQNLSILG